jgi:hypothetical protein
MTTDFAPRRYGKDSGDRILANLRHAAERVNAGRRYDLTDEQYADVTTRREQREAWTRIAADYGSCNSSRSPVEL